MPRPRLAVVLLCLSVLTLAPAEPALAQSAIVLVDDIRVASANAADNLVGILEARGVSVELRGLSVGAEPGDLADQTCIFDVRPDSPLSPATRAAMATHVQQGGGLFLVGENALFFLRNDSMTALIDELGGGPALASAVPDNTPVPRDIIEPVNPNHFLRQACTPVSEVDYDGVGNGQLIELGRGTWLTGSALSAGAAIWDGGALPSAPNGAVVIALDVNFLATIPDSGTLDFHISDPLLPTQNRPFVDSLATYLCGLTCCAPAAPAGPRPPSSALPPASPRSALSPCSASSAPSSAAPVVRRARVSRR